MGDLFRFFCMNPAHRLLLVSTESAAQVRPIRLLLPGI